MQRSAGHVTALLVGAAVLGPATGVGVVYSQSAAGQGEIGLYAEGVALSWTGERSTVRPDHIPLFHAGSRVMVAPGRDASASEAAAARQRQWLADGEIPGITTAFEDMSRAALIDLDTLALPNGAVVAGWSSNWRYVWPRDASFVAAAFARTDRQDDAFDILTFLQSVQEPDGTFHARYERVGSGAVPDDRGVQLDGAGWALWGARAWFDSFGPSQPPRHELRAIAPLIRRSADSLASLVDPHTGLIPVSSDYWERGETAPTLGTAAPILAGLRAAPALLIALNDADAAQRSRTAAGLLDRSIRQTFGARGYPRVITGTERDAAVAFLLPPFTGRVRPDVHSAWVAAGREMRQPAGGLSPGVGWKNDGMSWTPETALFALAAASSGEPDRALEWLSWLDTHRTALGSLPEKVTAKGHPAAVAPLAWTAALVVLTLDELSDNGQLPALPRERPLRSSP